ncbi:MAG TPA: AMP-binding protein [Acidimicrobiales bacterium]|jgi:acyl-CoA synthetase (AMP-forming)/AMP-acid ligase II|nr:AMP-binding protein [Acidimicrobiales bacterium]
MKELVYHRCLIPASNRFASKTAVIDGDYRATYSDHLDRVLRLTNGMSRELGLNKGDRFAALSLNSHYFIELYHAGFLGGTLINPLNLRLAPMEMEYILKDSGAEVVFVDPPFAHVVDRVREAAGVKKVVLMGTGDVAHDLTQDDLVEAGSSTVPEEPEEDDPAILMYTGGTTGLPKGVLMDNRAAMLNLYKVASMMKVDDQQVFLHQVPMFHVAGMLGVFTIPATGGMATIIPLFDPGPILDLCERDQVTLTVMVPTMIQMVLDHPSYKPERLASLQTLGYGASPMPTALLERVLAISPDIQVVQAYGMTENFGILTMLMAEDHRRGGDLLRSAGRPVVNSVVTIQDPEGKILGRGETGEVCAQGGNFMREYWHRPEQTEAAFAGGWYHTGDAGYLNEEGYLFLVDRVKDMIVSGGENIYSAEVENAIASYPGVAQVAVIGVPSDKWGEAVLALVVTAGDVTINEDDLKAWCRERIAAYKVPKTIEFRTDALPLSGALKVLKRELRAPYWEGHDRSVS